MTKNKNLLYILILGTLLIWGVILYKIMNVIGSEKDELNSEKNYIAMVDKNESLPDTFTILANYTDPFLGKLPSTEKKSTPLKVVELQKPIVITPWPAIVYLGVIKNQKSNKQFVMVQINNQSNAMKLGEIIEGVTLLKVYKDSVEVKFNKEKKFIKKI
jgi:hypothetical protein